MLPKIKITVKQDKLVDNTSTESMLADRMTRCTNRLVNNPERNKVVYELENVPADLFSNNEFLALLTNPDIEIENLILYAPCQATVLDVEVPEIFPKSTYPEVKDEEENVIQEARQATVREYFARSSEHGDKAMIELWGKDVQKSRLSTDFMPNRELLLGFIGFVQPYLIGELLVDKSLVIKEWEVVDEQPELNEV